jgi:uncharacterized repeat protein (TIGR03803 family)
MRSRTISVCVVTLMFALLAGDRAWAATRGTSPHAIAERVLFSFNYADGAFPSAGLIFDHAGNLYGTTLCGSEGGWGCGGTVFELSPDGGGGWTERLLHTFVYEGDPAGPLTLDRHGNLYGTVQFGGLRPGTGSGAVFELISTDEGWTYRNLHVFNGSDGRFPTAGLVIDERGNIYGTAAYGGALDAGTAFELTPDAFGGWTETTLHSFYSSPTDGMRPYASLTAGPWNRLYGTTYYGGGPQCGSSVGCGTVFELTPATRDERVMHAFESKNRSDGGYPTAGLISDREGNLYGTTLAGGVFGRGTIYELPREGSAPPSRHRVKERVLYSFGRDSGRDGILPSGALVLDGQGNLYGTAAAGGISACNHSYPSCGVVFKLARDSRGARYSVLYRFRGGSDGGNPDSNLIFDRRGNLYGTTPAGGAFGYGTVFEIMPGTDGGV